MKRIARSLRRELILNYFGAQKLLSSGVVEGLNNQAKVSMRISVSARSVSSNWPATTHLGDLPEPETTHDLF
jgi:transposase